MSAAAQVDWFAQNAPQQSSSGDWFSDHAPGTVSAFTSNPNGEGTYKMVGPQGQNIMVPFSKVRGAQDSQFQVVGSDAKRYEKDAAAMQPGMLDRLAQWGAEHAQNVPSGQPAVVSAPGLSIGGEPARVLLNVGNKVVRNLTDMPASVARSVASLADPKSWTPAGHAADAAAEIQQAQQQGTAHVIQPGEVVQPSGSDVSDYVADKIGDAATAVVLGEVGGAAVKGAVKIAGLPSMAGNFAKSLVNPADSAASFFAKGVDEPIPGTTITPRERYQSAQNLGVKLDAADATNSPVLAHAKRVNENSLLGGGIYDRNSATNQAALRSSIDGFLDSLYTGDRSTGGPTIKNALQANQAALHQAAENGFADLTSQTGNTPMAGAPNVGDHAQSILDTISPLADRYPSLAPGKTMAVLQDLAQTGKAPKPTVVNTGLLDDTGAPLMRQVQGDAKPTTFADLQKLRSAVHDLTTTNPDLVKSQSVAPLQRMTAVIDDAMTSAGNGLTPAQEKTFRDANSAWAEMKSTYDDPQSPLYHAVRTDNPSLLYSGQSLGPRTPESALDLTQRLTPDALGALRRGIVEGALKNTNDGSYNLKTFGTQWNRIPEDYRQVLFTPEQNQQIKDIANTSNLLSRDANPSGTAKTGQKIVEGGALLTSPIHPAQAVVPLAQYPLARVINSPRFTEKIMASPADIAGAATKVVSPESVTAGKAAGAIGGGAMWQAKGAAQMQQHLKNDNSSGLTTDDISALTTTQKGRELLARSSGVQPNTAMMRKLIAQAALVTANAPR